MMPEAKVNVPNMPNWFSDLLTYFVNEPQPVNREKLASILNGAADYITEVEHGPTS
jgi:hypothetical protein